MRDVPEEAGRMHQGHPQAVDALGAATRRTVRPKRAECSAVSAHDPPDVQAPKELPTDVESSKDFRQACRARPAQHPGRHGAWRGRRSDRGSGRWTGSGGSCTATRTATRWPRSCRPVRAGITRVRQRRGGRTPEAGTARSGGQGRRHVASMKAQRLAGIKVRTDQPNPAGIVARYGPGVLPRAVHGLLRGKVPAVSAGGGALIRSGPVRGGGRDGRACRTGLRAEAVSLAGPRQGPGGLCRAGRGHRDCVALVSTVPGNRARAGTIVRSMMGNSETVIGGSYGRCDLGRSDGGSHRVHWPASRWVLRHGVADGPTSGRCRA